MPILKTNTEAFSEPLKKTTNALKACEVSLKSQEQICLNLQSALKKSGDEFLAIKNVAGVDTKLKTAALDVARMSREMKAMEINIESGEGTWRQCGVLYLRLRKRIIASNR